MKILEEKHKLATRWFHWLNFPLLSAMIFSGLFVGKIIDVQKTDATADFMVYTGSTPEDMQAATTANMDVKKFVKH